MRLIAFIVLFIFLPMADGADVYRWIAPDGSVYFSDRPHTGAERIRLREWPPAQPRSHTSPPSTKTANDPDFTKYERLSIVKPEPGETLRDNQGNINVTLHTEPNLNETEDHRIQILIDGRARGVPSPTLEQSVSGVTRGRHRISAQVVDKRGQVIIRSPSVSFFLIISSPLFHPPRPDAPVSGVQQAPRAPMAPRAPRAPHAPFRPAAPIPSPTPAN